MSRLIDLTGQRFGRLVVKVRRGSDNWKSSLWLCQCDCGNNCLVSSHNLRTNHTQSCGCLQKEATSRALTTHGYRNTKLYGVWNSMLSRCQRKNNSAFAHYGGRGISVCDEWRAFDGFLRWSLANGYREGLSIDRIDNDKGYCPDNCRWETMKVQANNRRYTLKAEYNGEIRTVAEWADTYGIKYATLRKRLKSGWSIDAALQTPTREVVK